MDLMVVFELDPEKTLPELLQEVRVLSWETICGSDWEVNLFPLKSPRSKKDTELKQLVTTHFLLDCRFSDLWSVFSFKNYLLKASIQNYI